MEGADGKGGTAQRYGVGNGQLSIQHTRRWEQRTAKGTSDWNSAKRQWGLDRKRAQGKRGWAVMEEEEREPGARGGGVR